MPHPVSLPAIITAARAGSTSRAWQMFELGGYLAQTDNAAALAVKGRLLKDRALRATGADRQAGFVAAAQAYAAADAVFAQPYTRINVATSTLFAGDPAGARVLAASLLTWLDQTPDFAETAYYLAATRAEAHVLLGDLAEARSAMETAVRADPDGWADRAATLRQLALILQITGERDDWLAPFRPPRSLHYAGHLGIAADHGAAVLSQIAAVIAKENIGFGYGALAAGADLLVAEALLTAGAELHVVLPVPVEHFCAQSVRPYGTVWQARFDACLAGATSVNCATSFRGDFQPLATQFAAEQAMGAALLNAEMLESSAIQLLIADLGEGPYGEGTSTARQGEIWRNHGWPHQVLRAPRTAPVAASGSKVIAEGREDLRLTALVHISFEGAQTSDDSAFATLVDTIINPFRAAAAAVLPQPELILPIGNARIAAFADVHAAWNYVRALLAVPEGAGTVRVAGHYALVHWLAPSVSASASAPPSLVGRAMDDLTAIATMALPDVFTISDPLAAALCLSGSAALCAECIAEHGDMRVFALKSQ